MSGVIDPLLTRDPLDGPAEATADVTALLRQQRPRLVRLAAAIALDRRLAVEIVDRATAELQRHIATVDDPARELERTVVQRATARAGRPRIDRSRQGRRRLASTRPAPVAPVFDRSDRAAVWHVLTTLEPHQRAVLVLADWPTGWQGRRACDHLAETTGWGRRSVSSWLEDGIRRVEAVAAEGATADAQVADALAAAMAQLAEPGEEPPGHEVAVRALDDRVRLPSGRPLLRLARPRRRRLRWCAWVLAASVLVAGTVATVWSLSRHSSALLSTPDASEAPLDERLIRPQWFEMLRPLVPERFDRLALIANGPEEIAFLAADTTTGRTLDIRVDRRGWEPVALAAATTDSIGGPAPPQVISGAHGAVRAVRADGAAVEVTCELCDIEPLTAASTAPDVGAIAATVANGFVLEDVGSGFGAADTSARSALAAGSARSALAAELDLAPADRRPSVSGRVPAERIGSAERAVDVLIVRGLVPVPANAVRSRPVVFAGGRVGWLVSSDGVGVRITVADPTGVRTGQVLDDLLDIVESSWSGRG